MRNKSRYFLVSYGWYTTDNKNGCGEMNIITKNSWFPSRKYISDNLNVPKLRMFVTMNIFEFKNKSDYDAYKSQD